jgi:hypothetical protein
MFFEFGMVDKVQKPGDSDCYATVSEPFRFYMYVLFEIKILCKPEFYDLRCQP